MCFWLLLNMYLLQLEPKRFIMKTIIRPQFFPKLAVSKDLQKCIGLVGYYYNVMLRNLNINLTAKFLIKICNGGTFVYIYCINTFSQLTVYLLDVK